MSGRGYEIDWFRPNDSNSVTRLFREVYGDGYPVKIVYQPEEFAKAVARQDYIPVVARTAEEKVVGFAAFYRSAPNPKLYEMGLGMVAAEFRGTGILGLLMRRLVKVASTLPDFDVFFGEAVCNHVLTQRGTIAFKTVETAIEIDLMPAEAYEKEKSAVGRVSTVVSSRTFVPRPHAINFPEIYSDYLTYIYSNFDDSRTLQRSAEKLRVDRSTSLAGQVFESAGVMRISVQEEGTDFATALDAEEMVAGNKGVSVIQVWLNLSRPWVGACAEILRSRGYFFCGIFARWFGEDALLMEKIEGQPNWEGINLYTDRAKQILDFIKADWEQVQKDLHR